MAILTVSLFLPYTVHFEINGSKGSSLTNITDEEEKSSSSRSSKDLETKPILISEAGKTTKQKNPILAPPSTPASFSNSPITSGFNIDSSPQNSPPNNEDFFYKNSLKSSSNLKGIAPLGETEVDTVRHPNKSYILRRNQSFSYIQPRSRAEIVNPAVSASVVEGVSRTSTNNLKSGNVSILPKRSQGSSSANLLRVASQKNLVATNIPKSGDRSSNLARFSFGSDDDEAVIDDNDFHCEEKYVPFGGFSSPNIGRNILHNENIFDTAPWTITPYAKGNGGLRNAINFSIEEKVIKNVKWVGTVGMATDELSNQIKLDISDKLAKEYDSIAVFPDDFTFQGFYSNFCKQILWPTLHYQVPDDAKSKAFEDHSWKYYQKLNELFVDEIVEVYKKGDVIWIHDYHLLLVPQMLREKLGPEAKIGFFLHAAFPSSEVFRCLAQRKKLLNGMLGANSIGFQIPEYCRHFMQTCNRILLADVVNSNDGLLYDGKFIEVFSNPIGIDAKKLALQIEDPVVDDLKKLIQERYAGKKLIVNRDKLDRLRGVKQKLLAYEMFLKTHPEYVDKTTLIQICLKSNSSDADLEYEIISIVERINSLSKNFTISQPVVFLHQDIDFQQYLALISIADTFIVSTMREGMNLTCHEFIVATEQNKPPLILSEFTGSAYIFNKGALLINPWDLKQISNQIFNALTMSKEEKFERWNNLHNVLLEKNCYAWVEKSLKQIQVSWNKQQERRQTKSIDLKKSQFISTYNKLKLKDSPQNDNKRLFILDFDTLVSGTDKLMTSSNTKMAVVSELASVPNNIIFIMSYMKKSDLDLMYGRIYNIGLISENGAYIKLPKINTNWISLVNNDQESVWMDSAIEVMNSMSERLPGSYLEIEESTIRFHFENCEDKYRAISTISDCVTHINEMFSEEGVHATAINEMVVIQQIDLPVKALTTILSYYEKGEINFNKVRLLSPSTNSSPISQPEFEMIPFKKSSSSSIIDLMIYISTSNPITEPAFEYCNNLSREKKIPNVFTVAAGQCGDTSAMSQVDGMNKLLTILSILT